MLRNHVECHKTDKISTAGFLKGETTLQEKKKKTNKMSFLEKWIHEG